MTRAGETLGALSGEGGVWRDILVRPFREDDAEALARFWRDREFDVPGGLYHDLPKLDGGYVFETMRENRTLRGTVALKEDRIVGYHELRRMNPTVLLGCYLNLAPEIRGQGFGARFAFVALQFVASLPRGSFRRIVSFVSPGNHVARRLYHRLGFLEPRPGELEILTLTLLSVPAFARFAKLHVLFESYDAYARAFSFDVPGVRRLKPTVGDRNFVDRFVWRGLLVFPQRFTSSDDWIDVVVDAKSHEVCHVACPEWTASLVPHKADSRKQGQADFSVSVTNTGKGSVPVRFPVDPAPTLLGSGETMSLEAALRSRIGEGRQVSWACSIDGMPIELGSTFSFDERRDERLPDAAETAGSRFDPSGIHCVTLENGTTRATLDLSQGGSLRSLVVRGTESLLSVEKAMSSLGWIFPWRGGLFTVLEAEEWPMRLEPWGPFPGYAGFSTAPTRVSAEGKQAVRHSSKGCLSEKCTFQLEPEGIRVQSRIENRGDSRTVGTFGLFGFLQGTTSREGTTACSAEGHSRKVSRRSFEIQSEESVAIEMAERRISLRVTEGNAVVRAFNLGDDGLHLMMTSGLSLEGGDHAILGARLRVEVRS